MKGNLKFPDEETNEYREVKAKNFAEMISFSDTTLAAALDNLSNGKISHADSVEFAETAEKDSAGNILTDTYLTLASGAMTGTPTAPTNSDTSCIATTEFMQEKIREVCGDVESGMTLARLIESINKNPHFAADIAKLLTGKQNFSTRFDDLKNLPADVIPYFDGEKFVGAPITAQGKKILAATDVEHFRWIIQATQPEFAWDETEKIHWVKTGNPTITTANAKFSKALQCSAGNIIQSKEAVTFGGRDFTIDIWALINSSSANYTSLFQATLGGYSNLFNIWVAQGDHLIAEKYATGATKYNENNAFWTAYTAINSLCHFEFCYRHSDAKLFVFQNGVRPSVANERQISIDRVARTITLGGATCSISSFRILDGVCLHTGNFAVPNKPYELTDETVTCINF